MYHDVWNKYFGVLLPRIKASFLRKTHRSERVEILRKELMKYERDELWFVLF